MSRSILTYLLKEAFQLTLNNEGVSGTYGSSTSGAAGATPEPVDSGTDGLIPGSSNSFSSRRTFLQRSMLGLVGAAAIPLTSGRLPAIQAGPPGRAAARPVITIIGGGMAGLNYAWQLQKAGYKSTVYESSNRFGGRMFTVSGAFGEDLTTDFGGEWVDDEHFDIRALCQEFNIGLYDSRRKNLEKHTYFFEGRILDRQQIYDALLPYVAVLKRDTGRLPAEINKSNAGGLADLDSLSITAYLDKIQLTGWLHRFLVVAMESEYGADAGDQSAINLLIILRPPQSVKDMDDFEGQGAEVMKIKGGSQHLCQAVYEKVKQQVYFGHELTAVSPHGKGFSVTLKAGNRLMQVKTDYLILTLPFSRLRKITLNIPLPAMKVRAINELGYGNSAKLIMGFSSKPWAAMGHIGKLTSDLPFHTGWDSSLMQSDTRGTYTIFSGGKLSNKLKTTGPAELAAEFLPELDKVYPGMLPAYTGKSEKFIWETYPHNLGAYSYYKVGQWTSIAGHEGEAAGQLRFAGEHCSQLWQGYMNGAALSARLDAGSLISEIKSKFKVHNS